MKEAALSWFGAVRSSSGAIISQARPDRTADDVAFEAIRSGCDGRDDGHGKDD